jgi:hypothetical protein
VRERADRQLSLKRSGKENDRDILKSGQQSSCEKMVTLAAARKVGV